MLNFFDILIIGLFITIVYSLYKILKPEDEEIKAVGTKDINKKTIKSLIKAKDKKLANLLIETLSDESIETKAQKLSKLDKSFEPQSFMANSQKLFASILESFEKRDREKLKTLVSTNVYNIFDENMKVFEKNKQTLDTEIIRFKKLMIKDIFVDKKHANILVEFTTEQTTVLKDETGKIIKGDDNQIETIVDNWHFSKDYTKSNPSWILTETIEI